MNSADNGMTWVKQKASTDACSWQSVTYGSGVFVATAIAGATNRVSVNPWG